MRWLKRKLRNWLNDEEITLNYATAKVSADSESFGEPIRFSVTPARGGIVVATRVYDRVKDRSHEVIHVIHDDEDVAHKVGDIVAMELMKA
jgi:hypothetical protein